jgi:putative lipoprotein
MLLRALALVVLLATLLGTALPAAAAKLKLSGTVTYLEKIALPPNARLRLSLVDQTAPGQPPRVQAEAAIATPGQVPLNFGLSFDDKVLTPGHSYALLAEIVADGKLFFQNTGGEPVEPAATAAPLAITMTFVGHLQGEAPTPPAAAGSEETAPIDIRNITWRLADIAGTPVLPNAVATLSIGDDLRAGGRGSCNSYFSQVELNGSALRFSAVGATRMACAPDIMAQETSYFDALTNTRFWHLEGERLVLTDNAGGILLAFTRSDRFPH